MKIKNDTSATQARKKRGNKRRLLTQRRSKESRAKLREERRWTGGDFKMSRVEFEEKINTLIFINMTVRSMSRTHAERFARACRFCRSLRF